MCLNSYNVSVLHFFVLQLFNASVFSEAGSPWPDPPWRSWISDLPAVNCVSRPREDEPTPSADLMHEKTHTKTLGCLILYIFMWRKDSYWLKNQYVHIVERTIVRLIPFRIWSCSMMIILSEYMPSWSKMHQPRKSSLPWKCHRSEYLQKLQSLGNFIWLYVP